jgi:hypothetical protein
MYVTCKPFQPCLTFYCKAYQGQLLFRFVNYGRKKFIRLTTPDLEAVAAALQEYPYGLGNLFRLLLHHHGRVLDNVRN